MIRRAVPGLLLLATALLPRAAIAEHVPGIPGWQQRVHYRTSVTYTPAKFQIAGEETLTYWNLSPDTLPDLHFHLYLNAYRPGSHMARRNAERENWRVADLPRSKWGGEWIDHAALLGGDSLRVEVDDTLARIPLRSPFIRASACTIGSAGI